MVRKISAPFGQLTEGSGGSGLSASSGKFLRPDRRNRSFKFSIPLIEKTYSLGVLSIPESHSRDLRDISEEISRRTTLRCAFF